MCTPGIEKDRLLFSVGLIFFLVSFGISGKIKSSNISPGFRSDHSLILIDLIPFETKRGKGFWKMNCSHLREKEYVYLIKNTIKTTNEINHEANPHVLWDVIKMAVRGESIKYGSKRKKSIETEMRSLEKTTGFNDTKQDSMIPKYGMTSINVKKH